MNILSKADILKNRPALTRDINCPTMGGDVRIKAMSASTKDVFEQEYGKLKNKDGVTQHIRACFLVHSIVDDANKLIFTMADVELLGKQDGRDMDRLFSKAREMSGFGDEDEKELKKN